MPRRHAALACALAIRRMAEHVPGSDSRYNCAQPRQPLFAKRTAGAPIQDHCGFRGIAQFGRTARATAIHIDTPSQLSKADF